MLRRASGVARTIAKANNTPAIVALYSSTNPAAKTVTIFPGDGIGPEISESVFKVFDAAKIPIEWEFQDAGKPQKGGVLISEEALDSVKRNKVALKGPLATPIGKGHKSLNLTLRKSLGLYANVRPVLSFPNVETPFQNVDLVVIRENTEGEYSGLEHEVVKGVVESLKIITRAASERITRYAFQYARDHGRKKVSALHKASIMKKSDGLFLHCAREVAKEYPDIQYEEVIIDAACMKLVKDPSTFDVMVTPNLIGDIVSDLGAGLIGGLGLTPSGNFGEKASMFEAVHGSAPDIAGQGKANPTALLLSSIMMLRHMGWQTEANTIHKAILEVFKEPINLTGDLGGKASTSQYTQAIIDRL